MVVKSSGLITQRSIKRRLAAYSVGLIVILTFMARPAACWPPENQAPPMGWDPWNIDHCGDKYKWDEEYYKKAADIIANSGLRDLGYRYLTIECRDHYRDQDGHIQPNPAKFPNGFRAITDYIHKKGLKVRDYTDAGEKACCHGRCFIGPGSLGHYEDDAESLVAFGFDGVKIDWCGGDAKGLDPETQYLQFADAIRKTDHPFCVEICSWGKGNPWEWGRNAGTFWRTSSDIDYSQSTGVRMGGAWSILMRNLDDNRHPDSRYVGPGKGWNYPDMLVVGLPGGLDEVEERTQFSMWAMMASPLFLGNDVFHMPDYARRIVMNKEVIAIDQDPLGIQGDVVREYDHGKLQVWVKQLEKGSKAVALLNRDAAARQMTVNWSDIGISGKWRVRDLWEHVDKGSSADRYTAEVPSHGTVMLKISPLHQGSPF
jgi:alpha-galactosidase